MQSWRKTGSLLALIHFRLVAAGQRYCILRAKLFGFYYRVGPNIKKTILNMRQPPFPFSFWEGDGFLNT